MTHTLRKRKTACLPVCRKERSMDNKLKFQQLECYKLATDEQKEKLNKEQYFDLDKLPVNQLQTEFVEYIYYRGTQVSILTIKRERHYFNSLCEFFRSHPIRKTACLTEKKTSG